MAGSPLIHRIKTLWNQLSEKSRSIWRIYILRLPPDVQPDELLTSFVYREDQVVRKTNKIHHSRLMPRRNQSRNGRLETSICRSNALTETQLWLICSRHFDVSAPKPAIGRGMGPASAVFAEQLSFDPDGIPYREHANIVGWHDDPRKPASELKHFWMDKAQRIAAKFSYEPRVQH